MIIGIGGPSSLQGLRALLQAACFHFERLLSALVLPGGGDGRAHGDVVTGHRRLMIRRSETQKST